MVETTNIPEGFKQTDIGIVPIDWDVNELEKVGRIIDGDRGVNYPSRNEFSDSGYCLFLSAKNVTKEGFDFSECIFISKQKDNLLNQGKLVKRDVVLTTGGTVGNIAFFSEFIPFENIRINSGMVILRNEKADLETIYLYRVLQSRLVQNQIDRIVFGSAQPQLTVKGIAHFQIPIPPTVEEQQAIATALSDVDALISALDKRIAKKRDIKQAAMQQLLTGKARLPGFSGEWELRAIGEIFQFLNTANNSRSDLSANGEVKYIHYGDIHTKWESFLDCENDELPLIQKRKLSKVPFLEDGDLVMADASEDYGGIGISVEVKNATGRKVVAGLHTLLLRSNKQVMADGFKGYLQYIPTFKGSLMRIATGISVYGISKKNIRDISIRLPAIPEQQAIATILSDMDAEIAALEQRRDKTRALKQGMMQELLTGRIRLT